jgi:hypothetical protein
MFSLSTSRRDTGVGWKWSTSLPGRLPPSKQPERVPETVWMIGRNISFPSRDSNPWSSSPQPSRCTHYAKVKSAAHANVYLFITQTLF